MMRFAKSETAVEKHLTALFLRAFAMFSCPFCLGQQAKGYISCLPKLQLAAERNFGLHLMLLDRETKDGSQLPDFNG